MLLLFNERLKYLREKRNIKQTDLSEKLELTRSAISAWEAGINEPTLKNFVDLLFYFNVSADYLLSLDNNLKVDISDLNEDDRATILNLIDRLKKK